MGPQSLSPSLTAYHMGSFQKSLMETFGDDKYSLARKEVLTNMCSRPMQVRKGQSSILRLLLGAPMPPRARRTLGEDWGGCPPATPSTGSPWAPELGLLPPAQTCLWAQLEETFQAPLPCCPPAPLHGLWGSVSWRQVGSHARARPKTPGPGPHTPDQLGQGNGAWSATHGQVGTLEGKENVGLPEQPAQGPVLSPHCGLWAPGREISLSQPVGRGGIEAVRLCLQLEDRPAAWEADGGLAPGSQSQLSEAVLQPLWG